MIQITRDLVFLYLRPRTICAGIGCKRHMDGALIEDALLTVLKKEGLSPLSLKCISTIPLKAEEPGILATARHLGVPVQIISTPTSKRGHLRTRIRPSEFVAEQTGVLSVSTASAYLASGRGRILQDKVKFKESPLRCVKAKGNKMGDEKVSPESFIITSPLYDNFCLFQKSPFISFSTSSNRSGPPNKSSALPMVTSTFPCPSLFKQTQIFHGTTPPA